jgi:hypothetical protein
VRNGKSFTWKHLERNFKPPLSPFTVRAFPDFVWGGCFPIPMQVKAGLGLDRARFVVTGSAPISPHVHTFFRVLLGCNVHEGYGQTEGCAAATITACGDFSVGHVGPPVRGEKRGRRESRGGGFSCRSWCPGDGAVVFLSRRCTWKDGDTAGPRLHVLQLA